MVVGNVMRPAPWLKGRKMFYLEPGLAPEPVVNRDVNLVLEELEVTVEVVLAPSGNPTPTSILHCAKHNIV